MLELWYSFCNRTMDKKKRKDLVDTPLIYIKVHKPKTTWNLKTIEHYIQPCLDEVYKGEYNGTALKERVESYYIPISWEMWKAIWQQSTEK